MPCAVRVDVLRTGTIAGDRVAACRCEGVGGVCPEGRRRGGRPGPPARRGCSRCTLGTAQGSQTVSWRLCSQAAPLGWKRGQTHPSRAQEAGQPPGKPLTRHAEGARPRVRARPGVQDRCARPGVQDGLPGPVGGARSSHSPRASSSSRESGRDRQPRALEHAGRHHPAAERP